jgi:membrane fusion protein, heavy metal efflux system
MNAKHLRLGLAASSCLAIALLGSGCQRGPAAPAVAPAAPEKPRSESDLAKTTISRVAQTSLGLRTTPVRIEVVQEQRSLSGWIMVRPGNEVTLTAPVGGYIRAPAIPAALPAPGQAVRQGQELFRLEPVLSPLEHIQLSSMRRSIENDLSKARENLSVAENELKRIEKLYAEKLKVERDLEQARKLFNDAQEDFASAEDKLKLIVPPGSEKSNFRPATMSLTAPRAGVALLVNVSPGQFVGLAAPLATIADLSRPWVRVPVPELDLPHIDRGRPVQVSMVPEGPGEPRGAPLRMRADPVGLVPQVDPLKHTADLIYELKPPSEHATLAKDQMVVVAVPLGARSKEAVVPYSAILFDAYGGTWLYIDRTPSKDAETCVYERLRVELGAPVGTDVVVRPPLKAGEPVVTEGAAALFSREFYRPPVVLSVMPAAKK